LQAKRGRAWKRFDILPSNGGVKTSPRNGPLEQFAAQSGEPSPEAMRDQKLIGTQGRLWRKSNPRFDLF